MKHLIALVSFAGSAAVISPAAANDISANGKFPSSVDVKSVAPGQSAPAADPETELMLLGTGDLENRPPR